MIALWGWNHEDGHDVECHLLEADAVVVGLAHVRAFHRPLASSVGGSSMISTSTRAPRGAGGVDALLAAVPRLGAERGWTVIRWITAEDNHGARRAYDRVATRTAWVTYDMDV